MGGGTARRGNGRHNHGSQTNCPGCRSHAQTNEKAAPMRAIKANTWNSPHNGQLFPSLFCCGGGQVGEHAPRQDCKGGVCGCWVGGEGVSPARDDDDVSLLPEGEGTPYGRLELFATISRRAKRAGKLC
eukprot:gene9608-biopygen6211